MLNCRTESSEAKRKRPRTAFTAKQIKALESEFQNNKYLSVSKRLQLSRGLGLSEVQVCHCAYCPKSSYIVLSDQNMVPKQKASHHTLHLLLIVFSIQVYSLFTKQQVSKKLLWINSEIYLNNSKTRLLLWFFHIFPKINF